MGRRLRVTKSEGTTEGHQLDFTTPGISPLSARVLKHIRHNPNSLKKPLGLPQILHLLYFLTLNFGSLFALFIKHFLANYPPFLMNSIQRPFTFTNNYSLRFCLNGMPKKDRRFLPSSSVFAVVTIMISIPCTDTTLSYSISGNINCSLIPIV